MALLARKYVYRTIVICLEWRKIVWIRIRAYTSKKKKKTIIIIKRRIVRLKSFSSNELVWFHKIRLYRDSGNSSKLKREDPGNISRAAATAMILGGSTHRCCLFAVQCAVSDSKAHKKKKKTTRKPTDTETIFHNRKSEFGMEKKTFSFFASDIPPYEYYTRSSSDWLLSRFWEGGHKGERSFFTVIFSYARPLRAGYIINTNVGLRPFVIAHTVGIL